MSKIFINNLSYDCNDSQLAAHFGTVGTVKSAHVQMYPSGRSKGWALVEFEYPQDAQRAIAEFNNTDILGRKVYIREDREGEGGRADGAPRESTGAPRGARGGRGGRGARGGRGGRGGARGGAAAGAGGGHLEPRLPPAERPVTDETAVYVGNLPWSVSQEQLLDHFRSYGAESAEVPLNMGGKSKGYGIVKFASAHAAKGAVQAMNDTAIEGRTVHVRLDHGPNRKD